MLLLLSLPFALFARDDWRERVISLTPSLPWPQWLRTEAMRLDRLSLEERRRRKMEGWQKEEASAEVRKLEQDLRALRALAKEERDWVRQQESAEQREKRMAAESERAELERRVAEMEEKVQALIQRQEEAVTAEVQSSEQRLRSTFLSRVTEREAELLRAAELRLQEAMRSVEGEAERQLSERLRAEVQQAREEEVGRGVVRIIGRLQGEEEAVQRHHPPSDGGGGAADVCILRGGEELAAAADGVGEGGGAVDAGGVWGDEAGPLPLHQHPPPQRPHLGH